MQTAITTNSSKPATWAGRILSALAVLFLIFDGVIKVIQHPQAVEPTTKLGYAAHLVQPLGLIELICLVLYVFPRTAILGAVLMTGYLGGAVATQVRAGADTFSLVFPLIIGALLWGGLYLRDSRLRQMLGSK
ncbi:MAG: DoxX family protein [Anaerolineae bacterium]|nr:DoxX family protein [Anaerolineae bacterium]